MPRFLAVLVCALAGLVVGAVATAHEGAPGTGFQSRVSLIQPGVPGLLVEVLGGDELLSVRNWSGRTVVLQGPDGQPFLRFGRARVWRHDGTDWRVVERGTSHSWHDPRIHWTGPAPERSGLVGRWRIDGTADGEPFAIVGFIGYAAPPSPPDESSSLPRWVVGVLAAGGALLVAAALALPRRRREGEDERRETATER